MQSVDLARAVLSGGESGARCALVPLDYEHTHLIVGWRNDPESARWFLEATRFTPAGHQAWLDRQLASGRDFNWVIQLPGGKPIGMVALYHLDFAAKTAEFGRLLIGERNALGSGFGREATELVLKLAQKAGLRTVYLFVKEQNLRARSLYDKLGFATLGVEAGTIRMSLALAAPRGC